MIRQLLVAALVLAAGAAGATEFLQPPDKVVVDGKSVLVLGRAEQGKPVPITVEAGGKSRTVEADKLPKGRFFAAIALAPGLNRIEIAGKVREVFRTADGLRPPAGFGPLRVHAGTIVRCSDCHLSDMALKGGGFPDVCITCHVIESQNPEFRDDPLADRHFRSAGARCGKCHDPHGAGNPKLLLADTQKLCARCHGDRGTMEGIHPAFEEGSCAACHDPHFSGFPNQLKGRVPEVCAACHDEGTEVSADRVHPPVAEDHACATCHDPHTGGNALLRTPVPELCGQCHEDEVAQGHGEDLEDCTQCHDPHGDLDRVLARGDFSENCRECHDEVGDEPVRHEALDEGCPTCHDPHTPRDRRLVKAQPDLCADCHEVPRPEGDRALHPALEDGCTGCHGPHGGAREKLLASGPPELCLECHDDPRENGEEIHPALEEGCFACHDPHVGFFPGVLAAPQAELCTECHEVEPHAPEAKPCSACHDPHASDEPHFLRKGITAKR